MNEFIVRTMTQGRQRHRQDGVSPVLLTRTIGRFVVGNHSNLHTSQRYPDEFSSAIALVAAALLSRNDQQVTS